MREQGAEALSSVVASFQLLLPFFVHHVYHVRVCSNCICRFPNLGLLSLIPEILFLVEQIRPRTTQVYNLWAPVSVLLQSRALEAVEGV
jgi:hypothetical protein